MPASSPITSDAAPARPAAERDDRLVEHTPSGRLVAQRGLFRGPDPVCPDDLYSQVEFGSAVRERQRLVVHAGSEVGMDTYFGRFPASYWQRWTVVTAADVEITVSGSGRIAVLVESLGDFLSTPADSPLVDLVKAVKRSDHLLVAEAETSAWVSSWPLFAEIKNTRRGILLQPEPAEGETILRTSLPRVARSEFPPGRGYYVAGAPVFQNLHRFFLYTLATSTWGWDTGRAITNVVAIVVFGPAVLLILRRAHRRAAFSAPVTFAPEP